jgi:hypothetical protein
MTGLRMVLLRTLLACVLACGAGARATSSAPRTSS